MRVTHPGVQLMADEAQAYAARFSKNLPGPKMLVIVGESGCGKTLIASKLRDWVRSIAFHLFEKRMRPDLASSFYAPWPEIADAFRAKEYGAIRDMIEATFLVIDDIGAEQDGFKDATDKLCQILSRRDGMWTTITTNIAPANWAQKFDNRVYDRLFRGSQIVDATSIPSYSFAKFKPDLRVYSDDERREAQ